MGYILLADKVTFAASGGTGSFQDAVNQAQTRQLPLFVTPGTYSVGNIIISAPVLIYATPGTVTFVSSSSTSGLNWDIRSNTSGAEVTDVTLRGLGFWGGGLGYAQSVNGSQRLIFGQFAQMGNFNALITAYKATRLIVEDCQIGGSGSNGLALWNCTAEIRNNDFGANFLNAIYACDGWSTLISDNFVRDNKNAAITVVRTAPGFDGTILRGNRIYNTGASWNTSSGQVSGSGWLGNAIYVYRAFNLIIADNVCFNSTFSGVRIFNAWHAQITGNQIQQSGETAIFVECPVPPASSVAGDNNPDRYEGGVIANNSIVDAGVGVSITNGWYGGRRVAVSGNQIKNIRRKTIVTNDPSFSSYQTVASGIVGENDCAVTGNVIEDCPSGAGVALMSGGFSSSTRKTFDLATGNAIRNCQIGIGFFKDSAYGSTLIASNVIDGASGGAIVPVNLPAPYSAYTRISGSTDYGTASGGLYTGKPFSNVMVGLNFVV